MAQNNLLELRKFLIPEFVFGKDARLLAGRYAKNFGAGKVLVVTDKGVIASGWVEEILGTLEENGVKYCVYSEVTPNPRDYEVAAGAEKYNREGCSMIIAIGGGSPIDCAKGIGIVCSNGRDIGCFEGVDNIRSATPPIICIPTTAGSSADVSQFAMILNMQRKLKMAIISKAIVPDISLIDPVTLTTLPPYLTACTGMDALTHAIEAYVSNASSAFTDIHAIEAIKLISGSLKGAIDNPNDLGYRANTMLGSLHAGLAFSNASLGAVHAMAHSIGGLLDKPHGECIAMLLEHVVEFNFQKACDRYKVVAEAMGLDLGGMNTDEMKNRLTDRIRQFRIAIGINRELKDIGLEKASIPVLSAYALQDACLATNPVILDQNDIEVIYGKAY